MQRNEIVQKILCNFLQLKNISTFFLIFLTIFPDFFIVCLFQKINEEFHEILVLGTCSQVL
jgi:hypothetical protein